MALNTDEEISPDRFISDRAAHLWLSGIKETAMLSASVDDVTSLAWGIPSFQTPEPITNAGQIGRTLVVDCVSRHCCQSRKCRGSRISALHPQQAVMTSFF